MTIRLPVPIARAWRRMVGAMIARLISATDGPAGEPMPIALRPDGFADACRWIVENHEGDEAHRMLDRLVTSLLTSMGFGEGMDVFLAHVRQFHKGDE